MLCHVLAGFDQPPQGWMARLTENATNLGIAGRADLAAAWIHAGRKDRAKNVLLDGTMDQIVTISTGGRLTSQVREQAVLLNVLMDLDPSHPWIPTLVKKLEAARMEGAWGTTLDNASALAALARYQSLSKHEDTSFDGTVRMANAKETAFNHTKPLAMKIDPSNWPAQVITQGKGDQYLSVVYEGLLPQGEIKPFDRQLTVRRKWLSRDGKPLDLKTLKVGDLIHVEVELAAPTLKDWEKVENICVVDALPGGTEADDPRLATSETSRAEGDEHSTDSRTEYRDDRVLLFAQATKKPHVHRYAVRVTAAGTFVVPPIEASCMYDTRFRLPERRRHDHDREVRTPRSRQGHQLSAHTSRRRAPAGPRSVANVYTLRHPAPVAPRSVADLHTPCRPAPAGPRLLARGDALHAVRRAKRSPWSTSTSRLPPRRGGGHMAGARIVRMRPHTPNGMLRAANGSASTPFRRPAGAIGFTLART